MKVSKTLGVTIIIALVTISVAYAQIPNAGFENWITPTGQCGQIVGWHSTNIVDTSGSNCPVSMSTDHYPTAVGSTSVKLQNNIALLPNWDALGIMTTTNLDTTDRPLFPINGHPNSLCGYYKFTSVNNDTMSINLHLYYQGTEVALATFMSAVTTSGWTAFNAPISSYNNADSARMMIGACYFDKGHNGPYGNSVLYVDNLSFDTLIVAGIPAVDKSNQNYIFPNPANETLTFSLPSANQEETIELALHKCIRRAGLFQTN